MARKVYGVHTEWTESQLERLKQFEALVRADEREVRSLRWDEYIAKAIESEREACAKVVDDIEARCIAKDVDDPPLEHVAAAIRARGELK
jgi:RNA-binding protein YlmH